MVLTYDICEWCNMKYPKGKDGKSTMPYYEIYIFDNIYHKICGDCYEHLTEVD